MLKKMTTLKNFSEVSLEELVKVNGGCGVKEGISPACQQKPSNKNQNKNKNKGGGGGPTAQDTLPSTDNSGYQTWLDHEMEKRNPQNYWK